MSEETHERPGPAFLNELAPDVVLEAAILNGSVSGAADVRKVIGTVGGLFTSQAPGIRASGDNVEIYGYEAGLPEGMSVTGVITVTRGTTGEVTHIGSLMRPLGAVLWIAGQVKDRLGGDLDAALFA
ncbi:hypothetical protein [Beijerinckia sp. L45]|uniref:hypothetical protein n=1 Tax=Beijerinckia sp. L45 TaxID=1641855 RepID=UPI00131A6A60|nr:hypothetical protein [Beijerinckia sp. L45]